MNVQDSEVFVLHSLTLFFVGPVVKDETDALCSIPHCLQRQILQPFLVTAVVPLGEITCAV